jgi:pimeloyl-[acyl-carrier protein] methyl ester esterase
MTLASETIGHGSDLVILHGWGMNTAIWHDFADRLTQNYQLTLIDLPGHGLSPFDGQNTLLSWAESCLVAAPERAVWLGWSLGAMVTLQAGLVAPERIKGIIAVAGMPRFVIGEDWPHAMAIATLDQFIEFLGNDMRRAMERFLALQMLGSDLAIETLKILKTRLRERPDPSPDALQIGLDLLKYSDLRERLSMLECPTAWIYGDRDTLAPSAASENLLNWLPEAAIHCVARAAHTPFLSHPDETERLVRRCLEAWDA